MGETAVDRIIFQSTALLPPSVRARQKGLVARWQIATSCHRRAEEAVDQSRHKVHSAQCHKQSHKVEEQKVVTAAVLPPRSRAGPQTEKWENLNGNKSFCIFGHFEFFFDIFTSFSLEHGPFFSTLNPTSLNSFLDFHTFSRSFLWLKTAKKLSSVKIFPFFCLGPRPNVECCVVGSSEIHKFIKHICKIQYP